jgi:1,4-dihydroxy-6-naphthoate synthase
LEKTTYTLGFSPCPNDTFIFDAMVNQKIDTEGLTFDYRMADVEALNQQAFRNDLDITKLSFHAFIYLTENYLLLNSGSALGNNCGPLLIAKRNYSLDEINDLKIAIPGEYTTANFLMAVAFPKAIKKNNFLFSDIENAIITGQIDAGVIIHENRFTYEQKGLKKIIDLGEYWESHTGMPIPLGGIAVRKNISLEIRQKINRILKRSIEFAFANPQSSKDFVKCHAQEMDPEVMQKHIDLYVNDYSLDLGNKGREAIMMMFRKAFELGMISTIPEKIFSD